MGKAKRNRPKHKAKPPTGLPSARDVEKEEEEQEMNVSQTARSSTSAIQTIIEQLQGTTEDKVIGLNSLSMLFDNQGVVEDIVRNRLIRIAAPLLIDQSSIVRHIAAGALRNLSSIGDSEICEMLVEEDIMTPLSALIQKFSEDWRPPSADDKAVLSEHTDTFVQAVHLLWNLCENNCTALKYFNQGDLLPILTKCLDVPTFGLEVSVAVAQCLHTVTENNPPAIKVLQKDEEILQKLSKLEGDDPTTLLLRTLACGLLLNVHDVNRGFGPAVVAALADVLKLDHVEVLESFAGSLASVEPDLAEKREKYLKDVADVLRLLEAQQTALEILANLCSGDDDGDDMEVDSSDVSDNVLSDSGLQEDEPSTFEKYPVNVPADIAEAIVKCGVVQKTWGRTSFPAEAVCATLSTEKETTDILKRAGDLRCRAFLCLNNLVSCLPIKDLGGMDNLYTMWSDVGTLLFGRTAVDDAQLWEASTSAMRAIVQKLAEHRCQHFNQLEDSDLQLLFDGQQKCVDANVRANLIRIIGTLGMIFTFSVEGKLQSFLKNIGRFLLDASARESELWVTAEALDTIMDVFGEDETDSVAAEIQLVDRLRGMVSGLKTRIRAKRKSLGEHYITITTVSTNLSRFITYKAERVAKLKSGR